MKNSWYYRFLGVVVLLVVSVNLQAQSNDFLQNSDLKRKGFRLAIDVPKDATENNASMVVLKRSELKMILPDKQFRSYKVSRNCFVASLPLLAIGAGYFSAATVIFMHELVMYHYFSDVAAIVWGVSLPFLIPGITLMVCSAVKVNKIAESYNKQRHSSYFQNGLQVNFGLVDNGIGVKLRF